MQQFMNILLVLAVNEFFLVHVNLRGMNCSTSKVVKFAEEFTYSTCIYIGFMALTMFSKNGSIMKSLCCTDDKLKFICATFIIESKTLIFAFSNLLVKYCIGEDEVICINWSTTLDNDRIGNTFLVFTVSGTVINCGARLQA